MKTNANNGVPVIEGQRIRLRLHRDDDVDALYEMQSDPQVMRYWSYPAWTERRQAEERLANIYQQLRDDDVYIWAIADRESDCMLGNAVLFSLDRGQARSETGYSLLSKYQGHGFAQEAMRLMLAFAFDELGLERIEADIDPRNTPSCRLAERLGFVREGLLRQRWRVNGEICDTAFYGLLRGEFVPAPGVIASETSRA